MRKMGNTVSPTVELTKEGDEYTFHTVSTFKTTAIKFKLGEEFDEETLDGRKVRSIITLDGNKMSHEQKGDKAHTIIREFSPTELVAVSRLQNICKTLYLWYRFCFPQTMALNNVSCTRIYKAL